MMVEEVEEKETVILLIPIIWLERLGCSAAAASTELPVSAAA